MLKEFEEYFNWCLANKHKTDVITTNVVTTDVVTDNINYLNEYWLLNNDVKSDIEYEYVSCFNPTLKTFTKELFSLLDIETAFRTDNLRTDLILLNQ